MKVTIKEYERRRAVWLEALRSGKFKQTTEMLQMRNQSGKLSYCCLGVACRVAINDGVPMKYEAKTGRYDSENLNLPKRANDYFGFVDGGVFADQAIVLYKDYAISSLIALNDTAGARFKEIAQFIEDFPELVWKKGTYRPLSKKAKKEVATRYEVL